ncbi:MAG: B12-binding domain-containing radical SAM protein [Nitrospirae bacterium]|nr:B12-binding domain-containing radical SAM protein [Nitrospirota bacterium]
MFQPFLPILVPVGIAYLLSYAEQQGVKADYVDVQFDDEDIMQAVASKLKGLEPPYLFGFSVLTGAFKNAITVSQRLKLAYPDSKIFFGNIHSTAMPEEVLAYNHIDGVVRGEGEKPLLELYRCVKEGRDFTHVDNLSYVRDSKIIHNPQTFISDNLNDYPPFPYHRFDEKKYDISFVISSRGCPYSCIFCSNRITTGRKYRYRDAAPVVDELEMLYRKYNIRFIRFIDDNLLVSEKRVYELIEEVKKRGLSDKLVLNFQARGDNVNYKILKDMYDAGFKSVFFGIETASEKVMKTIKKGETVEDCIRAVSYAKQIGLHVSATFIYALPGETHQDRMECVKMSRELGIDMARFNNATPYPGTELYEIAKRENRLYVQGMYENFSSVSTFIENPFKKTPFSYVPEGSTENEIRRDLLFSYYSYYLNVDRLKEIFANPDNNVGWFDPGSKILDTLRKIPAIAYLFFMLFAKFIQLFYYMVFKKETSISFRYFLKVFDGIFYKVVKGS